MFSAALILFLPLVTSLAQNSSVSLILSKNGLNFFSDFGHTIINKELPKIQFPPFNLAFDEGPGNGTVTVNNLTITKFKFPKFEFSLVPDDSISWNSTGGAVKLYSPIDIEYDYLTKLYFHGWINVTATRIQTFTSLGAFGKKGHLQLKVNDCFIHVSEISLHVGGDVLLWIVDLFRSQLSELVKDVINSQLCGLTRTDLIDQANQALNDLPHHLDVGKGLFVDYNVFDEPVHITKDFVKVHSYFDVIVGNFTCKLEPKMVDDLPSDNSYMVNLWLSKTIGDCAFFSLHKSGLLKFTMDKNNKPKFIQTFMQTNCRFYEVCVGKYFTQLHQKFPDRHVSFLFYSSSEPVLSLDDRDTVMLNSSFYIDMILEPEAGKPDYNKTFLRLKMDAEAEIEPELVNNRIKGKTLGVSTNYTQVMSNIGDISKRFLSVLQILAPILKVSADTVLTVGIPVPVYDNVTLSDRSKLLLNQNGVGLFADLRYNS